MPLETIIEIICAVASVALSIAAIIISIIQFHKTNKISQEIDRRETNRYREQVTIEAKKFITKYNETDEIQLIALCMTADLFDSVHPYRRSIYKEWCALSTDVKKEIISLRNFDIGYENFYAEKTFWDASLAHLKQIINDNYSSDFSENPYNNIFYDSAKYLLKGAYNENLVSKSKFY